MPIPSRLIPQADKLEDVLFAALAVKEGHRTFQDIAQAMGKVGRQGRYYRLAAEILGLIEKPRPNTSVLTDFGAKVLEADTKQQKELIKQAILKARVPALALSLIEGSGSTGVSREDIASFLGGEAPGLGKSMIPRRVSTLLSWLLYAGIVKKKRDKYIIGSLPKSVEFMVYEESEPLYPFSPQLVEHAPTEKALVEPAEGEISYIIKAATRERAVKSHQKLVNLMSEKIKKAGFIPKSNRYVDLATLIDSKVFLFEMKSVTSRNFHDQVRKAISQLYEYRYTQNLAEAELCIVTDNKPSVARKWLIEYLIKDRNILICWRKGNRFACPPEIKERLRRFL